MSCAVRSQAMGSEGLDATKCHCVTPDAKRAVTANRTATVRPVDLQCGESIQASAGDLMLPTSPDPRQVAFLRVGVLTAPPHRQRGLSKGLSFGYSAAPREPRP